MMRVFGSEVLSFLTESLFPPVVIYSFSKTAVTKVRTGRISRTAIIQEFY